MHHPVFASWNSLKSTFFQVKSTFWWSNPMFDHCGFSIPVFPFVILGQIPTFVSCQHIGNLGTSHFVRSRSPLGDGSIPIDTFLVGWTSIYQLFWGSLGGSGFEPIPTSHFAAWESIGFRSQVRTAMIQALAAFSGGLWVTWLDLAIHLEICPSWWGFIGIL
jgi:hypothetical protein